MPSNVAVLLLGSNINPRENLSKCVALLNEKTSILGISNVVRTKAVGSDGPDFLNAAVKIETSDMALKIKSGLIKEIEDTLCRKRVSDKNAPRTMDIDIIIFNKEVLDENLWKCLFIAMPVCELMPNITHPKYGLPLAEIVNKITNSTNVKLVSDFKLRY